jgi:hypothetical protein
VVSPLVAALALPGLVATAAVSALCGLCVTRRGLQELVDAGGPAALAAAMAQPKHLTPRGRRNALRLLRRLARAAGVCHAAAAEALAALGVPLLA